MCTIRSALDSSTQLQESRFFCLDLATNLVARTQREQSFHMLYCFLKQDDLKKTLCFKSLHMLHCFLNLRFEDNMLHLDHSYTPFKSSYDHPRTHTQRHESVNVQCVLLFCVIVHTHKHTQRSLSQLIMSTRKRQLPNDNSQNPRVTTGQISSKPRKLLSAHTQARSHNTLT